MNLIIMNVAVSRFTMVTFIQAISCLYYLKSSAAFVSTSCEAKLQGYSVSYVKPLCQNKYCDKPLINMLTII